jgi:hypothetical protein
MIAEKARRIDGVTKSGQARDLEINRNRLAEAALQICIFCDLAQGGFTSQEGVCRVGPPSGSAPAQDTRRTGRRPVATVPVPVVVMISAVGLLVKQQVDPDAARTGQLRGACKISRNNSNAASGSTTAVFTTRGRVIFESPPHRGSRPGVAPRGISEGNR